MFLKEKNFEVKEITIDLIKGEQLELGKKNSLKKIPILELENGTTISESISICRYLESYYSEHPKLFGSNALEIAKVDEWIRRVEFVLDTPLGNYWRLSHPFTRLLGEQKFKSFGEQCKEDLIRGYFWFNKHMQDRTFLAGEFFSMADIVLVCNVDFAEFVGVHVPDECTRLKQWKACVDGRASSKL